MAKRIDMKTDWTGTFTGSYYRIVSYDNGKTVKTERKTTTYIISKVDEGAYKSLSNNLSNPDISIGLAFKYCNGTKELLLVDTNDESQISLIATQIKDNQVTECQVTLQEAGIPKDPTDPTIVSFTQHLQLVVK